MLVKKIFRFIGSYLWGYYFEKTSSPINPVLEVCYINGRTILNAENVNYSYGSCQDAFYTILKKVKINEKQLGNVLILGFGVGCIARLIQEKFEKNPKIIGIEKDDKIIDLGAKYFETLKFTNVSIICDDAIDYIQKNTELFDLIIVDIFIDFIVPEKCEQELFLENIKRSLSPSGMLIFNKLESRSQKISTLAGLKSSFSKVMPGYTIHQINKYEPNYMFVYTLNN